MRSQSHWLVASQSILYVLFAVAVASAVAFFATSRMESTYTAASSVVVSAGLGANSGNSGSVLTAPQVAHNYATLATTRPALIEVIQRADLPYDTIELAERISAVVAVDSPFIEITMTDTDPARAASAADALADVLVASATIPATPAADGRPAVEEQRLLEIVERAVIPTERSGPRVLFTTVLSGAAAAIIAIVLVSAFVYLRGERQDKPTVTG